MVRPRFAKLPQSQQEAILRAALDKFAAHGFRDASLNRVIDAAGTSQGLDVLRLRRQRGSVHPRHRVELERLFACVGPFPIPTETDPDTVWSTLEAHYLRLMTTLAASPQLAALIRGRLASMIRGTFEP